MSSYEEITVLISPDGDDAYHVYAKSSQGEVTVRLEATALPRNWAYPTTASLSSLRSSRNLTAVAPPSEATDEQSFGKQLHRILFPGEIRDLLQSCRGAARSLNRKLCLSLCLDPKDERVGWLDGIPWELLYDENDGFIGLNSDWAIIRYLQTSCPGSTVSFPDPVKILVVAANSLVMQALDVEGELWRLEQAWRFRNSAQITIVDPPTIQSLERHLNKGPFHIIHFIGHGILEQTGEGHLAFETENRDVDLISGNDFAQLLRGRSNLPELVVLNACETGGVGRHNQAAAVASVLVEAGVPAVLAMRALFPDAAAIDFSAAFHEALAVGAPLKEAITIGRRTLFATNRNCLDWAIPVLYLRAPADLVLPESAKAVKGAINPGTKIKTEIAEVVTDEFTIARASDDGGRGRQLPVATLKTKVGKLKTGVFTVLDLSKERSPGEDDTESEM